MEGRSRMHKHYLPLIMSQQVNFFRGSASKHPEGGGLKFKREKMREDWGENLHSHNKREMEGKRTGQLITLQPRKPFLGQSDCCTLSRCLENGLPDNLYFLFFSSIFANIFNCTFSFSPAFNYLYDKRKKLK